MRSTRKYPGTRINLRRKVALIIAGEFGTQGWIMRSAERIAKIVHENYRRRQK